MNRITCQSATVLRAFDASAFGLRGLLNAGHRRLATVRGPQRPWIQSPINFGSHNVRHFRTTSRRRYTEDEDAGTYSEADHEHAVISTFDLFSIGIGPSSSHTVGPMRAGNIFVADLAEANLLQRVNRIRVAIYGSLALTGEGHMTPSALLLGLEGADVETVDTAYVPKRFTEIKTAKKLFLGHGLKGGTGTEIAFDYERDFKWEWSRKLPLHSNGMRLTVFDAEGDMLATNDFYSVGGGFVVNGALSIYPASNANDQDPSDLSASQAVATRRFGTPSSRPDGKHVLQGDPPSGCCWRSEDRTRDQIP